MQNSAFMYIRLRQFSIDIGEPLKVPNKGKHEMLIW